MVQGSSAARQSTHLQGTEPQMLPCRQQLGAEVQAEVGWLPHQCQRLQKEQHPARHYPTGGNAEEEETGVRAACG